MSTRRCYVNADVLEAGRVVSVVVSAETYSSKVPEQLFEYGEFGGEKALYTWYVFLKLKNVPCLTWAVSAFVDVSSM